MTDWNAVQAFMANVVAWPGQQDLGHVNLHYSMVNPKPTPGKPLLKGMGWPFRDLQSFISRASWVATTNQFRDVWFCTSTQSATGTNSQGKAKAIRLAKNALLQKALWVDIDIEANDPKHYGTVQEALAAVLLFAKKVGLPQPSAIVFSGGGLHVYWISKTPLVPPDWHGYANGLKQQLLANNVLCDTGLTTDIARILRVPGTFNHKYDPPKPVELSPLPLVMYDFAKDLAFLKSFAPQAAPAAAPRVNSIFADGADMASFKAGPIFKITGEPDLNAGIEHEEVLLKADPIFQQCGFFKDALLTGGANYDQTLWMYGVLGSTFMENGNAIAHAISKGHASYTEADTQALFNRKVAERADRGIGYPSCSTIKGAGCKSCETCPLFAKGKSPLNIRPIVTATVTNSSVQSPAAAAAGLPDGYELNDSGVICKVIEKTDKQGNVNTTMVPLFQCVMSDFWLQKNPGEYLNFTVTADKGFSVQASVSMGDISRQSFRADLGDKRVLINPDAETKMLEGFFLSMMGKLRALMAAQEAVPFGWYEENSKVRGFAYGGSLFMDDGTERPCGALDPVIAKNWSPKGEIGPWHAACRTLTDRKRPELTTIMLMAFASPLLALNGKNTGVMSAFGTDSGAGKSSAAQIGLSVWGHPRACKVQEADTPNVVGHKLKILRNLPFFWDEITSDKDRNKVREIQNMADSGKGKDRMVDGQKMQEGSLFQLMIHYIANRSYVSYLRRYDTSTTAPYMRVLEWQVKRIAGGPGHMNDADAQILLDELNRNYGHMGLLYARFLAMNHVRIKEEFRLKCNWVEHTVGGGPSERYWYTLVAAYSLAAKYARECGVDVDPQTIEDFLFKVYHDNVMHREGHAIDGSVDNFESILTEYLTDRESQERSIWSDWMSTTQGKPSRPVIILKQPTQGRTHMGPVVVRFAVENKICVINARDFDTWLTEQGHSDVAMYAFMQQTYKSQQQKLKLCGGWLQDAGRVASIVLHIDRTTPLWDYLLQFAPPDLRKKMEEENPLPEGWVPPEDAPPTAPKVEPVETGLDLGTLQGRDQTPTDFGIDPRTGLVSNAAAIAFVQGATRG